MAFSIAAGTARALDWGWGGWGGWVDTPEGVLARGMGQYYEGLGVLNKKTAMADAINTETMIRWNEYMYDAHLEGIRRTVARRQANSERIRTARSEILKNLLESPSARDVENGNALNAAVTQLSDPRISTSSLRTASAPIEAGTIREIPFRNASEAVTIVLSQIKDIIKWPAVLNGEQFAAEKKAFEDLVETALREDEEGDISPATLARGHELVRGLNSKLAATTFDSAREREAATRFLRTFGGLVRMLDTPDTSEAFNQLRQVKSTTLGNLIAFMQVFNLRFGAATTPAQRAIYRELFTALDGLRSRVLKDARLDDSAPFLANPGVVGDFFSKFDVDKSEAASPK
jgi:hypothetical protein